LPAPERRRQAIKYLESIAAFYDRHGVTIQNLFDFVPELITWDDKFNLEGGRQLLTLINAHGGQWALEEWNAGRFAPLFASAVAAAEIKKRELKIQSLVAHVAERQNAVELLAAELAETHGKLLSLTTQLNERDRSCQALSLRLAESDQLTLTYSSTLAAAEHANQLLANEMKTKTQEIGTISSQLELMRSELDKITNSLAWRVASRYGGIKYRYLLPFYRLLGIPPSNDESANMNQVFRTSRSNVNGKLRA
jgi:hypothetical protein